MFEALAKDIEELEVPPQGDAIVEVLALYDRLGAAIASAVGDFDANGCWEVEGASSMTAWLRHRCRQSGRDAARLRSTARRLRRLPVTAAAVSDGVLSAGHVAAIVANLSNATVGLFAEQEFELVPVLAPLGVREAARVMQRWRERAEATLPDDEVGPEPRRSLHHSQTLDGRWATDGSFDPEGGSVLDAALRLASSPDAEGEASRSPAQRRADALVDLCRWFLDHNGPSSGRQRPHLNVVIDFDDLLEGVGSVVGASSGAGTPLDATTMRRLLCDAGVHRVLTAGASSILDYGRTTRTIPPNLWAALVLRDRHCRHPGCDRGTAVVRGASFGSLGGGRHHRDVQPVPGLFPPPPSLAPTRLGNQAAPRRRAPHHHPGRPGAGEPAPSLRRHGPSPAIAYCAAPRYSPSVRCAPHPVSGFSP